MNIKNRLLLALLLCLSLCPVAQAQLGTTISVQGNLILGPCGDTLLLRGVNYAAYNWGWSPGQLFFDEIAQSGANCVRIPWYENPQSGTPQTTYTDLVNLDSALSKCVQNDLIPILDLHDLTCQNDTAALLSLANWYTQPNVMALIHKYEHSIILNVANEVLYVMWTGNPVAAEATFINVHSQISNLLRNAGITVPIMIDGPDCGTNLDVLASSGPALQVNDPAHNTIFSAHAYWYSYANNDSLQMEAKLDNAIASGIPFILGEIANLQDDQTLCQYNLNYPALLRMCEPRNIGWLAWGWDNDGCPDRQMSTNGSFSSLTPYGTDLVHNTDYGLLHHQPERSAYLVNNGCPATGIASDGLLRNIQPYPNPSHGRFEMDFGGELASGTVEVMNVVGQVVVREDIRQTDHITIEVEGPVGMYVVRVIAEDGSSIMRKWIKI